MNHPGNFFRSWPLWRQISVGLLIALAIVTFLSGALLREFETTFLQNQIRQESQNTFSLLSAALIESVITEDRPQLETIINQSIRQDTSILLIRIENEKNVMLAEWRNQDSQLEFSPISFSNEILFEGEVFGYISIQWNVDSAYHRIEAHVRDVRLLVSGMLLLMAIIIVIWIHGFTVNPIQKINQQLNDLAHGEAVSDFEITSSLELVHLAKTVYTLEELMKLRKFRTDELESEVDRRTADLITANEQLKLEIAERERAETALKAAHAELEIRVAERTAELTEMNSALKNEVHERIQIEEELEKHRNNLEQLVLERTQELEKTQQKLVRQERLATVGQMTATVSHELRNPLGAMRTAVAIIKRLVTDEKSRIKESAKIIDRSVMRCDKVINDLLAFTRIQKPDLKPIVVDDWINDILTEFNFPNGIRLCPNLLSRKEVMIDPEQLRRAVLNLLDNACDSMVDNNAEAQTSGHVLTVSTVADNKRLEIIIQDTGSGISPDNLSKVEEPLFSTKSFGVGLGLPTVKQIMEKHHGGLEIANNADLGTIVRMWLPIDKNLWKGKHTTS